MFQKVINKNDFSLIQLHGRVFDLKSLLNFILWMLIPENNN